MTVTLRRATRDDAPRILKMLTDDPLGKTRETTSGPIEDSYWRAFDACERDTHSEMLMAERDGAVIGCLQLTLIPGCSRKGATRAQIESVRIAGPHRGKGHGAAMIRAALARAKEKGAVFAQLTSDVRRNDARRFYEKLGFAASHVGFKLDL